MKIFSKHALGNIELKNRIVMAPMTRSRAINNIPNEMMAEYYAMRADAGLLITEGTAPSANGFGYARIPGVDHSSQGAPEVPQPIKDKIREAFDGTFIASGGLDKVKAEAILNAGQGDLAAFGVPFLANPDLVNKMKNDIALNAPNQDTFFTPGVEGYLDYSIASNA